MWRREEVSAFRSKELGQLSVELSQLDEPSDAVFRRCDA